MKLIKKIQLQQAKISYAFFCERFYNFSVAHNKIKGERKKEKKSHISVIANR